MTEPRAELPFMPDYGVEASTWDPLPWSWAAERLAKSKNLWVVTVSGEGRPHALPVWGVWDDDTHRFAFSCAPRARKAHNIRENPQVVVMVDSTEECVSVEGIAIELVEETSRERWIELYLAKYLPIEASLSAQFLRDHLIFEVTPDRALSVIERHDEFATRPTRWVF